MYNIYSIGYDNIYDIYDNIYIEGLPVDISK